ncbi:MAG: DUF368 domain-containing protein [Nanoarchaeota archaeon]|nr:DUF368 domain-containing protein [Nanoarchaeota archaeon]
MNSFTIFLRGLFMGACDIVPGISGGTIAFITGIYDRLLTALGNLSNLEVKFLKKGDFDKFLKPLDLSFLLPLVFGIMVAVLSASRILLSLLQTYPSLVLSFFVGLILASGLALFSHVEQTSKTGLYVLVGLLLGALFSLLPTQAALASPSLFFVFIGGFLAITAMLLPGISGSFLLLVLGLYLPTLEALHSFDTLYLVVFALGAMMSLLFVSKGIKRLLENRKNRTMAVLSGLVLGALLVPLRQITVSLPAIGLVLAGVGVSVLLTKFSKK